MAKHKEKKKTLEDQNPSEVEGKMGESIKKKTKKKKKETHTVTMETIAENPNNISPVVGYFPSGYDPLRNTNDGVEELSTKLYRNVRRNNRLQVVVSPYGSQVDFVGTNYSGEATSAQLCTYSLGILDKETQTLKIVPIAANKIIRLEPRVRGSEEPDAEDPDTAKQELTAEERNDKISLLSNMKNSIALILIFLFITITFTFATTKNGDNNNIPGFGPVGGFNIPGFGPIVGGGYGGGFGGPKGGYGKGGIIRPTIVCWCRPLRDVF